MASVSGVFCVSCESVRDSAAGCGTDFCTNSPPDCSLVVLFGGRQVVTLSDRYRVAQPIGDYVAGVVILQFGLATGPEIVEEPWPGGDTGPAEDAKELGS